MQLLNTNDLFIMADIIKNKTLDNNLCRILSEMTKEQINSASNVALIKDILKKNNNILEEYKISQDDISYQDPLFIANPYKVENISFYEYLILFTYLNEESIKEITGGDKSVFSNQGQYEIDEPLILLSKINMEKLEKARFFGLSVFNQISTANLSIIIDKQLKSLSGNSERAKEKKIFIDNLILFVNTGYDANEMYIRVRNYLNKEELHILEEKIKNKIDYSLCQQRELSVFFYAHYFDLIKKNEVDICYGKEMIDNAISIYNKDWDTKKREEITLDNLKKMRGRFSDSPSLTLFDGIVADIEKEMLYGHLNNQIFLKNEKRNRL